jgi:3-oxoacyl-[acyl-carrier protein] reductase
MSRGNKNMDDFVGKTLLLTGASGGIGAAVASVFSRRGANLVLADRTQSTLDVLAKELGFSKQLGGEPSRILSYAMDASNPDDAKRLVSMTADRFQHIDFIVTSAGIYRDEPAAEMTPEQWRQTLAVNLDGAFYICAAAFPILANNSSIVNVTSMAAHCGGSFGHSHYGASKGGLLAYTRSLAREWGPKTRVNAVSPGVIETSMTAEITKSRGASILEQTPLKRFGAPSEIAEVVAFLCSDAASFITGEAIHVNGGYYMGG